MKISQVLRETEVPKIKFRLISFNDDGEFEGKCAMGVLACESKVEDLKLSKDKTHVSYTDIINAYKIPKHMNGGVLPYIWKPSRGKIHVDFFENEKNQQWLSEQIITLNDSLGLSFKEIGEFLEVTYGL